MIRIVHKLLKAALVLGILAACGAYLAWNLELQRFTRALGSHAVWSYALACVLFIPASLPQGLRLHRILRKRCSLAWAVRASFLGAGVNAILPARLGDVVKAWYLSLNCLVPLPFTLCGVFWERLFDIVIVLLLALFFGLVFNAPELYVSPLVLLSCLLCFLLSICKYPRFWQKSVSLIPHAGIRRQCDAIVTRLADRKFWPPLYELFFLSFLVWCSFSLYNTLFFTFFYGSGMDVSLGALVAVAGAIGMMVPGAPANIGTFEASVVAALTMAGEDKSEALAFAMTLHAVQLIPSALYAVYAALRGGWSLSELRFSCLDAGAEDCGRPSVEKTT